MPRKTAFSQDEARALGDIDLSPPPIGEADANRRFYLPELDALRFFAFFMVFVFHLPPGGVQFFAKHHSSSGLWKLAANVVDSGGFGVDLFFALSAFLITALLLKEREATGRVDVRSFYLRRILRIWPLYFFFLLAIYVLTRVTHLETIHWIYFVAFSVLAGNFALSSFGAPSLMISPLWSVSMEEQFYLLWAPAVRVSSRSRLIKIAIVMVIISFVSQMVMCSHGKFGDPIWFNTLCHLDPIALGILIAALLRVSRWCPGRLMRVALVVFGSTALIGVSRWCDLHEPSTRTLQVILGYPIVALGCGAFLLATLGSGGAGIKAMLNPGLIYLGKISYGLYVYHGLALALAQHMFHLDTGGTSTYVGYFAFSLTATVLAAAASYRWLESPFLRLKSRFAHVASRPI